MRERRIHTNTDFRSCTARAESARFIFDLCQRFAHGGCEALARLRKRDAPGQAEKELLPQRLFKMLDLLADGAVGDVKLGRRFLETQLACGGFEKAKRGERL